ncbi:hypothetical protein EV121DRAFT_210901, partial [Schizophyllum commune]
KNLRNGPLVEVLMQDAWIAHAGLKCVPRGLPNPFELPGEPRMLRCSKCICQKGDLKAHKQDCKLWFTRPAVENERRAEMSRAMALY